MGDTRLLKSSKYSDLTLQCQERALKAHFQSPKDRNMADTAMSIKGLLKSEKYSDLTLKCHDKAFKVHRAVVCTQSSVFAAAIDGGFKEATTREIDLSDNELEIVTAMVRYLYTGDYDDKGDIHDGDATLTGETGTETQGSTPQLQLQKFKGKFGTQYPINVTKDNIAHHLDIFGVSKRYSFELAESSRFLFNTKMYILGDKYDIPDLKKLAAAKYRDVASSRFAGKAFIHAADILFENTVESDREMADVVTQTAHECLNYLLDSKEFQELLKKNGDLGLDLVGLLAGRALGWHRKT